MKRAVLVLALLVIASCGSESKMDAGAQADLLGAAVAHRILVDNSFGGTDVFDRVEVVEVLGHDDDDGSVRFSDDDPVLTQTERDAIERQLAPKAVTFVPATSTPIDGDAQNLVAVVSIAAPSGDEAEATVTTGIYCGGTCGAGGTQRFALSDGGWSFVENIGGQWVS